MSDTNRREFVKRSALLAVALGASAWRRAPASRPLRILILGGTGFIGPHEVEYASARGHQLTLFNRGITNPGLFPHIEQLHGDRNGDLESLKGKTWDVCIDDSASNFAWVRLSAGLLRNAVQQYIYVSSISAYSDYSTAGMDVDAPTFTYKSAGVRPDAKTLPYGLQKALSEKEALKFFPDRATIVRPGLIVGPRDPTDRFTYWPVRIRRGGEVLAPGMPADPTQIIDARDLAGWMIRLAENNTTGTFNATGNVRGMGDLLGGIRAAESSTNSFTWVDARFLEKQKVEAWSDMPVWPSEDREYAGFTRIDNHRAVNAGLTFRSLAETARDTLAWYDEQPAERREHLKAGLTPERESQVLKAWHAQQNGNETQ